MGRVHSIAIVLASLCVNDYCLIFTFFLHRFLRWSQTTVGEGRGLITMTIFFVSRTALPIISPLAVLTVRSRYGMWTRRRSCLSSVPPPEWSLLHCKKDDILLIIWLFFSTSVDLKCVKRVIGELSYRATVNTHTHTETNRHSYVHTDHADVTACVFHQSVCIYGQSVWSGRQNLKFSTILIYLHSYNYGCCAVHALISLSYQVYCIIQC